jgi:hypothetical protein
LLLWNRTTKRFCLRVRGNHFGHQKYRPYTCNIMFGVQTKTNMASLNVPYCPWPGNSEENQESLAET